jgi:hypothetical protein
VRIAGKRVKDVFETYCKQYKFWRKETALNEIPVSSSPLSSPLSLLLHTSLTFINKFQSLISVSHLAWQKFSV